MSAFALLFTLAAIGISETAYLIRTRIAAERPVCPIGQDCAVVLSSKYNKLFLVPNDVVGLLFYIVAALIAAFVVIGVGPASVWRLILVISVGAASVMSLVFVYIQARLLRAWCFWCVMSAFTIWLMGLIILV